ncbi:MAG: DUF4873 domain-containing protein [Marmoricola sp.]
MTQEMTQPESFDDPEGYDGPAAVVDEGGSRIDVEVRLRGHFEPIDGRFHWYGRIQPSDALARAHRAGASVTVRTPVGEAAGRLSDVDPWGRFRITGAGRPPFPA